MHAIRIPGADEAAVRGLIARGEPGGVERKAAIPKGDGLCPSVAAFANTHGGWILLGVDDDGAIVGWRPPGRAQIHDHRREQLRGVDPMPAFTAELVDTVDGPVGVLHVPESAIKPHVARERGVVYEREPGGNRPIDSQAKLLALATTPGEAQAAAVDRLTTAPMVHAALRATISGQATNAQTRIADWIVAATPLSVTSDVAGRVRDGSQIRAFETSMSTAVAVLTGQSRQCVSETLPRASGVVIRGVDRLSHNEFEFTIDAAGVVVARWSERLRVGSEQIFALAGRIITPLVTFASAVLEACGAVGPSHIHGLLRIRATDPAWRNSLTVTAADLSGELTTASEPITLGAPFELPATEKAIRAFSEAWAAELGRHAGMPTWQRSRS
jgi:hypothetical protein